ncbi:MAG: hypothetical protein IT380_10030 [Myxococcales bacterium]|nr:hypothetical protein [Myxococcales bacterium]
MSFNILKSALPTKGDHLGDVIWWQLADAEVSRTRLETLWLGAGLDKSLLPEAPTAEKALKTAIRETQVGHLEHLLRLGKEDSNEVVFAVVHEAHEADGSLSYTQEARIKLDRLHEQLIVDNPSHELVSAVRVAFERLRLNHTSDDVRRSVVRSLRSFSAVALRESGGIYWVPRTYSPKLRQLQQAIETIGSSKVYLLPIHDSSDASRTLGEVAQASVVQELDALKFEVEGFLQSPPDRPSTLVRRLEAFESLKTKAALYRDILRVQVADLDEQLARLTGSVEQLLDTKFAA